MWYAGQPIGLGVRPILDFVWRYIVASLMAGIATDLILYQLVALSQAAGTLGAALRLVLVTAMFTCCYLAAIVILHRSTAPLRRVTRLFSEMASGVGIGRPYIADEVEINEVELEVT